MNKEKLVSLSVDYGTKFIIGSVISTFILGGLWAMFRGIPTDVSVIKEKLIAFDKRMALMESYIDDKKREDRFRRVRNQ